MPRSFSKVSFSKTNLFVELNSVHSQGYALPMLSLPVGIYFVNWIRICTCSCSCIPTWWLLCRALHSLEDWYGMTCIRRSAHEKDDTDGNEESRFLSRKEWNGNGWNFDLDIILSSGNFNLDAIQTGVQLSTSVAVKWFYLPLILSLACCLFAQNFHSLYQYFCFLAHHSCSYHDLHHSW